MLPMRGGGGIKAGMEVFVSYSEFVPDDLWPSTFVVGNFSRRYTRADSINGVRDQPASTSFFGKFGTDPHRTDLYRRGLSCRRDITSTFRLDGWFCLAQPFREDESVFR